ncbi:MAG: guanylate kinase [Desulfotalea sp.]|nr:MAG: guanylate kinase [Desulfotalea sp.]
MSLGRLFVVSAPSGAGKTTLLKRVMSSLVKMKFSVSHTTRAAREGEVDGIDYHFVSQETFKQMIIESMFLEHADVHGNLYGTSLASIVGQLEDGFDVVLDIDVQGAAILRAKTDVEAAFVFIAPPSLLELERRLRGRGTENEEKIKIRLMNAITELESSSEYDYVIVNSDVEEATHLLESIILAERAKLHRLPSGDPIGKVL